MNRFQYQRQDDGSGATGGNGATRNNSSQFVIGGDQILRIQFQTAAGETRTMSEQDLRRAVEGTQDPKARTQYEDLLSAFRQREAYICARECS